MKLKRFKTRDNKRIGIIIFTIVCILLVSGVILYRTFAIFEVKTNQNVIKGTVEDPGNIYFAFYQKNEESGSYEIQKDMPNKNEGYVLDEVQSYCGTNGNKDDKITVSLTEDYTIQIHGVTTSRTKCNLYFAKGIFIQGKGIPVVDNGDGLYKVEHTNVTETIDDQGFSQTEYRYSGASPNNYVDFNDEKWRIIGLTNVKTASGQIEQRIKIIRNENIGLFSYDFRAETQMGKNDWTEASLMKLLNGIYYTSTSGDCYGGEGNTPVSVNQCDFSGKDETKIKGLNENARKMLSNDIVWNIGGWNTHIVYLQDMYNHERGTVIYQNNKRYEWPQISDDGFASKDRQCYPHYISSFSQCINSNINWLDIDTENDEWLMNPRSDRDSQAFGMSFANYVGVDGVYRNKMVRPVAYLSKNIQIIGGMGTEENSYKLK